MQSMTFGQARVVALLSIVLFPRVVFGQCAVERAPVKTATDAQASQVRAIPLPATIASLHSIPAPRPLPHDGRVAPAETTIYSVTATLVAYRLTPQGEIQLVLSDDQRRTIVATIPSPACAAGSGFLTEIAAARTAFERRYAATAAFQEVWKAVEVQGIGFFDYFQGQRGLAPNGLSLYPVTKIDFTPSLQPKAPPPAGRRRAAAPGGGRVCPRPSLSLNVSRGNACSGEPVTISWQASNAASVTIDGVGIALPPSGSRVVSAATSTIYSGRAISSCGASDEATALVTLVAASSASLDGPSSVTLGNNATLSINVGGVTSWTLSSRLGNSISPSSGTSSRTASYNASRSGSDTVTLSTSGGACGNVTRTINITITEPANLGLRCCDGTRSKTCFSCSSKQGCCSSHGGVCGCP